MSFLTSRSSILLDRLRARRKKRQEDENNNDLCTSNTATSETTSNGADEEDSFATAAATVGPAGDVGVVKNESPGKVRHEVRPLCAA